MVKIDDMGDLINDPTQFIEREFTWIEDRGHSVRLINRNNTKQAITIAWNDLGSLRELITLALADEPKKGNSSE